MMGPVQAVKSCLRGYVNFEGRAQRSEYWWFTLVYLLSMFLPAAIAGALALGENALLLSLVFGVILFLPSLAVTIRRLHDINVSGWLYLVSIIPYIGSLLLLVMMCLPGTKGANKFGDDPKAMPGEEVENIFA